MTIRFALTIAGLLFAGLFFLTLWSDWYLRRHKPLGKPDERTERSAYWNQSPPWRR
jgi:hypothetical protein